MKIKNILFLCTASLGLLAFTVNQKSTSQVIPEVLNYTDTSKLKSDDKVFEVVETQPEFPGGHNEMMKFISKNFKYPEEARRHEITGRVLISYVVNEDGKVSDIKPLLPKERQLGYGLEEEAMRVISLMPDWTPGTQGGKAVKVRYTLPFYCTLDGGDKKEKKKKRK